eukprot:Protomagalhaensia_sp_Gyna_25__5813@NODE_859_length_2505_cov_330_335766_g679_i0_p2_GENE_NODE_859_length_2505_cov_330_335766_g679_i0NODE_859_length_2505_cov_330_335766_g679_i0_p2_ORF_typecomplete_len249_score16_57_NODE_859_length_2505_cov_330_335766_g679_i09261672
MSTFGNELFAAGEVPDQYDSLIIDDPFALQGKWKEVDKPFVECAEILGRLGFLAVKRKVVARCHSEMDLFIVPSESSTVAMPEDSLEREESDGVNLSTAASTPNTSVTPVQPLSPQVHRSECKSQAESDGIGIKWMQRQYFPMGREKSATFLSDGVSRIHIEDSDTGCWEIMVLYRNGRLIQRRYSEALGLTMYDTRCVLKAKFGENIQHQGEKEVWQFFQWRIVDHKNEDKVTCCEYYLKKVLSNDG